MRLPTYALHGVLATILAFRTSFFLKYLLSVVCVLPSQGTTLLWRCAKRSQSSFRLNPFSLLRPFSPFAAFHQLGLGLGRTRPEDRSLLPRIQKGLHELEGKRWQHVYDRGKPRDRCFVFSPCETHLQHLQHQDIEMTPKYQKWIDECAQMFGGLDICGLYVSALLGSRECH